MPLTAENKRRFDDIVDRMGAMSDAELTHFKSDLRFMARRAKIKTENRPGDGRKLRGILDEARKLSRMDQLRLCVILIEETQQQKKEEA